MSHEIDTLADHDAQNLAQSKRVLDDFDPRMLEAAEKFCQLVKSMGDLFGEASGYDSYSRGLNEWLSSQPGGDPSEKVRFLEQATFIGAPQDDDPAAQARISLFGANAVLARSYLLLRVRRDFLFGFLDLLRLRVISSWGYLRIQSESIAILYLISKDPSISIEWMNPDLGRIFYKRYHGKVIAALKELGLHDYYEQGSSAALHSRVSGVIPGIVAGQRTAPPGTINFSYQEVGNDLELLGWCFTYLSSHKDILAGLAAGLPEIDSSAVDLHGYHEILATLAGKLKRRFIHERRSDLARSEFWGT